MKKLVLSLLTSVTLLAASAQASVTINFGFGDMFASTDTSTPFADGGLINILAKTDGLGWGDASNIFTNLTNSFVPTGAALVASFGTNDSDGPGTVGTAFTYNYSGSFVAGQPLLLVGYSSLTTSSTQPGLGTSGFFFRTDATIDGSDSGWFGPADGATITLGAYTLSLGGSLPNNQFTSGSGALGGNGFTTVPEPSTYALMVLGGLVVFYMIRRRKVQA